jgi:hypothetical protein
LKGDGRRHRDIDAGAVAEVKRAQVADAHDGFAADANGAVATDRFNLPADGAGAHAAGRSLFIAGAARLLALIQHIRETAVESDVRDRLLTDRQVVKDRIGDCGRGRTPPVPRFLAYPEATFVVSPSIMSSGNLFNGALRSSPGGARYDYFIAKPYTRCKNLPAFLRT